ncbi:MAG TPA: hypothetical protein VNV66_05520 [Pilimelia sp.]|nr:hypothetical protein [Pilimelia sp.]
MNIVWDSVAKPTLVFPRRSLTDGSEDPVFVTAIVYCGIKRLALDMPVCRTEASRFRRHARLRQALFCVQVGTLIAVLLAPTMWVAGLSAAVVALPALCVMAGFQFLENRTRPAQYPVVAGLDARTVRFSQIDDQMASEWLALNPEVLRPQ